MSFGGILFPPNLSRSTYIVTATRAWARLKPLHNNNMMNDRYDHILIILKFNLFHIKTTTHESWHDMGITLLWFSYKKKLTPLSIPIIFDRLRNFQNIWRIWLAGKGSYALLYLKWWYDLINYLPVFHTRTTPIPIPGRTRGCLCIRVGVGNGQHRGTRTCTRTITTFPTHFHTELRKRVPQFQTTSPASITSLSFPYFNNPFPDISNRTI